MQKGIMEPSSPLKGRIKCTQHAIPSFDVTAIPATSQSFVAGPISFSAEHMSTPDDTAEEFPSTSNLKAVGITCSEVQIGPQRAGPTGRRAAVQRRASRILQFFDVD